MQYFLQGLLLGLAYVAPIGIQNLYVINSALKEKFLDSIKVALIVVFFDISLALACFIGIGYLVDKYLIIKEILALFGSIAMIFIGYKLAIAKPEISKSVNVKTSLIKIITACFIVTWLNPQAIIDGSLLLGGYRASLPPQTASHFIIGVMIASLLWFTGLSTIVSIFKKAFNENILRTINIICGLVIIFFGIKLGITFINFL